LPAGTEDKVSFTLIHLWAGHGDIRKQELVRKKKKGLSKFRYQNVQHVITNKSEAQLGM
jgi:hypothetical protein